MQPSPITEKPQPPAANECCESGCDPCVWDIYRAALQQWEETQHLPAVEVEPTSPATAAVIWLHGLGADGHDFVPIIPELGLPPQGDRI